MKPIASRLIKGYTKMLFDNFKSKMGCKTNMLWFKDSVSYFIRHPAQFLREPITELNNEKDISLIGHAFQIKLFLAEKDEFFSDLPIRDINKGVSDLSIDYFSGGHCWFFIYPQLFAEKVIATLD